MSSEEHEYSQIPRDWDRIRGADGEVIEGQGEHNAAVAPPQALAVAAAAWADLVTVLTVCAMALVGVVGFGYGTALPALPWSAALAVTWWAAAAVPLVVVRRGTPGMLIAGVVFDEDVVPRRVVAAVAVALLVAGTLGLAAILGARRSPVAAAAGARLTVCAAACEEEV